MVELKLITTRLDHGLPIEDGSISSNMADTADAVVEDDDPAGSGCGIGQFMAHAATGPLRSTCTISWMLLKKELSSSSSPSGLTW
jgi:hypothetical protein